NRKSVIAIILIGLAAAGCSGSDGADGAPGDQGPPGDPGDPGPPGPSGAVPVTSAEKINVEVLDVDVPAGGGAPTVSISLTNDLEQGLKGMPAANIRFVISQLSPGVNGGSSQWQSYITRSSGGVANAQATTETAAPARFVDNGDGTYQYTFANALTAYPGGPVYDQNKTHRIGVEIRTSSGGFTPENIPANNAPTDFLPTGGAPLFSRLIVDSDTCNACHDNLEEHGDARFDVEYCVMCHNPSSVNVPSGNTVDMKRLVHNIHSGRPDYQIISSSGTVHEWSGVVWPQDIRNCQTCHDESDADTPQASNYRLMPNRAACGTCHYDDGVAGNGEHDYAIEDGTHPGGFLFSDDTQCVDCHGPDGTVTNSEGRLVQVPVAHEIRERTAAEAFSYNILDVINTGQGQNPQVTFSVTDPTNADAAYDIHTDEPFTVCAGGVSRLSVNIAWSTTDYANIGSGRLPALPLVMNPLAACGGASTNNGDGTFTVTSATAIPATATGSLSVAIEGHPAVDVYNDGSYEAIAVTNAIVYAPITDSSAAARRAVVDFAKCDDCHNQLSLHGNNRTNKPEVCVTCHNPMMTDVARRGGAACIAALGSDDQTIDFKHMIHGIHASGTIGVPFGVCGFSGADVFDFVYPGRLNNCEGCHLADTYYPVDSTEVFGTTFDANSTATLTDDRVVSPNMSVCSACHVDNLDTQHMLQNGGDLNATKAADGSMISAGVETCAVCHGPDRIADVKKMHNIETFEFN
ncbi:MAG TPA: OmcA/MtrC family decaheme c-type cytochrome, partial [Woeseiaceae bacterium]|nr:OmcA/MtrC family decaheme c-type cytochrome [Woeseiaceae bacterium]